jgi:glycosyltransferase involved in cell wall biosynthesis
VAVGRANPSVSLSRQFGSVDGREAHHHLFRTVARLPKTSIVTARPDVIVTWLQNDYGQLGRAGESVAHALQSTGLARLVAYVEPNEGGEGPPTIDAVSDRGLHVYRRRGADIPGDKVAEAVIRTSNLNDPILLNFGVAEANWWLHHAFAPRCSTTALVTHDILHLWPGMDPTQAARLARIRRLLISGSDAVIGLSTGAIADVEGAIYVGHGCDRGLEDESVDDLVEPPDLALIPRPRALYFGALSVRIDARAIDALASSGVQVVLVGFSPAPAVAAVIANHPNVHFLGPKNPGESPSYLRHCDVGIVPHTDEAFTWSMEPHKVYNYACAGLRSVLLNCACPESLSDLATSTTDIRSFVSAVKAGARLGRLRAEERTYARSFTWASVGAKILAVMSQPQPQPVPLTMSDHALV